MMSLRDARRIQAKAWRRYRKRVDAVLSSLGPDDELYALCYPEWLAYIRASRLHEALVLARVKSFSPNALPGHTFPFLRFELCP